jgi:hypothetical protein
MSRVFVGSFYLETEPDSVAAPDGPGWYVDVRMSNGQEEIAPKIKIDIGLAKLLATAFEKATNKGTPNFLPNLARVDISINEAVVKATEQGKQEIKNQLDKAQALIEQIAELQKTFTELGGQDGSHQK